jgi:HlyD family secretion protein
MTVRRLVVGMIILGLGLVLGLVFLNRLQQVAEVQAQAAEIQSLTLHTVNTGDVEQVVSGLGTLEAQETATLSFRVSGSVETIHVSEGDYVFPGDVLIELNNDTLELEHQQALLQLDRSELNMQAILEPPSEDDIAIAEANIASARGYYYSVANRTTAADIQAAELRYQQAAEEYNALREARVWRSGSDEEIALEEARIGEASFNLEIARLQLDNIQSGNGGDLAEASARIRQAELQLDQVIAGPTEYTIIDGELAIEREERDLWVVENNYARTLLTTPIEGVVADIRVEEGQPISAGQVVITIANRTPLKLTALIDETDVSQIEQGLDAYIQLDALPDVNVPATVAEIAIIGSETNGVVSYETTFELDGGDPRALEGMTGEAFVLLETREDVLVVPNAYVRTINGQSTVDALTRDGQIVSRTIEIGLIGQENTEIVAGLTAGETIVLNAGS